MFQRRLFALAAMLGLSSSVELRAPQLVIDRPNPPDPARLKVAGPRPPRREQKKMPSAKRRVALARRRQHQRNKTCTAATLACVHGIQHYAGQSFITYCEHDRATRSSSRFYMRQP